MAAKLILIALVLGVASAVSIGGYGGSYGGGYGGSYGGVGLVSKGYLASVPVETKHEVDYVDVHPEYKFEYAVEDKYTHDIKSQSEHREGNAVKSEYSLVEPDGSRKISVERSIVSHPIVTKVASYNHY